MMIVNNEQFSEKEIIENENLKDIVKSVGNDIKPFEYYKQIDCPMPMLEKYQQNLVDNLTELFYTKSYFDDEESEEKSLILKNDICFIDNGILLFERFNIFIGVDGKVYIKVLTVLNLDWLEKLKIIQENISTITIHLCAYTEQLSKLGKSNDTPYSLFYDIVKQIKESELNKDLIFNIPNCFSFKVFALQLIVTKINNISFKYEIVALQKIHTINKSEIISSIIYEDTLSQFKITEFINKLLYYGEIIK